MKHVHYIQFIIDVFIIQIICKLCVHVLLRFNLFYVYMAFAFYISSMNIFLYSSTVTYGKFN